MQIHDEPWPVPPVASLQTAKTILLVEDQSAVREVVADCLRDEGFVVIEAATVSSGLAMADHADLLLTDIDLPAVGAGIALARDARCLRPDLPVIYFSGGPPPLPSQCVIGSLFLAKPFPFRELSAAIASCLETGGAGARSL